MPFPCRPLQEKSYSASPLASHFRQKSAKIKIGQSQPNCPILALSKTDTEISKNGRAAMDPSSSTTRRSAGPGLLSRDKSLELIRRVTLYASVQTRDGQHRVDPSAGPFGKRAVPRVPDATGVGHTRHTRFSARLTLPPPPGRLAGLQKNTAQTLLSFFFRTGGCHDTRTAPTARTWWKIGLLVPGSVIPGQQREHHELLPTRRHPALLLLLLSPCPPLLDIISRSVLPIYR